MGTTTILPSSTVTVNKFLGIPFASPPERFAAPVPPKKWHGTIDTTKAKPACIQAFIYPKEFHDFIKDLADNPPMPESEDCLYLSLFAPSTPPPPGGRSVLFFIAGGDFQFGSGEMQDGSRFAAYEDIIFVSANYRTNVFGFPPPEFVPSRQNLGFLDQRLALDWVQRNIHAFGGDPAKVLLLGQSAGAWSVDNLITSMPHDPPFRAAMTMSGQYTFLSPGLLPSLPYLEGLLKGLNCTSSDPTAALDCLKDIPAADIREVIERAGLLFYPQVDNTTMIAHPIHARLTGKFASIPLITGTVQNEGSVNVFGQKNLTAYLQQNFGQFPSVYKAVQENYPKQPGESDSQVISRIFSDFYFLCPQALQANFSAAANVSTWRYYFNATAPPNLLPPAYPGLGTYHGLDITMAFGPYLSPNTTAAEYAQCNYLRRAWSDFAKEPSLGPGWNQVGSASRLFVATGNATDPRSVVPAPADLDLAVIAGGNGDVAGVEVVREAVVDSKCDVFLPMYKTLAELRGDVF